jgi:hypothetical protein
VTCDWEVDRTCLPDLGSEGGPDWEMLVAQRNAAEDLAIQVLWSLSGRQFGVCSYIVRPCAPGTNWWAAPRGVVAAYAYAMVWWDGSNYQTTWCGCPERCRESGPGAVHLPGPAQEVLDVQVDGVSLDADQYTLEGDVLHRVGDQHYWPRQDLTRPMGEPNTWSVEYTRGEPVPNGVARLTGLLAKEFLAACNGDKCRLPSTVTNVNRQGISYQVFNPQQIYDSGKTGLREIDMWLAAVNPRKLLAAPSVL